MPELITHVPSATELEPRLPASAFPGAEQTVNPQLIEVPFEADQTGVFVDKTPPEIQIKPMSTFDEVRNRFAHEGMLGDEELGLFMGHAAEWAGSAIDNMVPQASEFGGLFQHFSKLARLHAGVEGPRGSGKVEVEQDPNYKGDLVRLDVFRLDSEAEKLKASPDIQWRQSGDARLVSYLASTVHEHSHSVARQIAHDMQNPGKYSHSFFAAYLSAHPNEGYTGILGSDPRIIDERFANGVAALTVTATMNSLGYSQAEQEAALRLVIPMDQEYSEGQHHHVEAAEHARERNITIGRAALELAGYESEHLAYEGGLGYKKQLTPHEVGEVLYFAKEVTMDGASSAIMSPEQYREAFDAQYGGKMHPDVEARLAQVKTSKAA